jgi:hypothetical protein
MQSIVKLSSASRFFHNYYYINRPIATTFASSSTMKFRSATLSVLAVSIPATSAWAPSATYAAAHHHATRPAFSIGGQTALFSAVASYSVSEVGEAATESFRLQFKEDDSVISPWHDIPLMGENGGYNMVVEIPKMTKAKMEVATKEESNPIAQDIKKGKLRDYHGPIFWNYGKFLFGIMLSILGNFNFFLTNNTFVFCHRRH